MGRILIALVVAVLWTSSVSAQSSNRERYERIFERCMDSRIGSARVTRREMRSIREECRHRASARTQRQARRTERDRRVYVPQPERRVQPLERY